MSRPDRAPEVLGPAVAGTWYPASAARLEREVDRLLAEPSEAGPTRALIVPHAGYVYSGAVAGRAFGRLAKSSPRRVVLLGPSHRAAFRGACVPAADAYRTPLGDAELDRERLDALGRQPGFHVSDDPFAQEHSLEAELPFLQRVLEPGWSLVPVLIGPMNSSASLDRVSESLLRTLPAEPTLFVVSSDFTHYGPRFGYVPFRTDVERRIRELDMGAIDCILRLDRSGFAAYVAETGATICGHAAIEVLLRVLEPGPHPELVAYDTSARQTGDRDHSVSYAALVFRS